MNSTDKPATVAPLSEGLGPRCIECDGLVQWRCPTCAIRSQRAPLYTQDEVDARVATERERVATRLRDTAAHMRANADRLRRLWNEDKEARARELAASYVDQLADVVCLEGPNDGIQPPRSGRLE